MARITVEDCLEKISNRFELVMVASKRARQLARDGADPFVAWENDKPTVVALREIAGGYIDRSVLGVETSRAMIGTFNRAGAGKTGAGQGDVTKQ